MNILKAIITISILSIGIVASAQIKQTIHNTYKVKKINSVELDILGDIQFKKWDGTYLMTETQISLSNVSKGMLQHLIKKKRYELSSSYEETTLKIESVAKERKQIITRQGECKEKVTIIIYVPKYFDVQGENTLVRTGDFSEEKVSEDEIDNAEATKDQELTKEE